MAKIAIQDLQVANFDRLSENLVEILEDEQSNITGGLGITIPVNLPNTMTRGQGALGFQENLVTGISEYFWNLFLQRN